MAGINSLTPEQLARRMDANPARRFVFEQGTWSAEHSVILATRPYPLDLKLCNDPLDELGFDFQDDGTAFVDALERRQSPFGSLCLEFEGSYPSYSPLSSENLERLFNLDFFFEKLTLPRIDPGSFPMRAERMPFRTFSLRAMTIRMNFRTFSFRTPF